MSVAEIHVAVGRAAAGSIEDRIADVEVSPPRRIGDGFRPYDSFNVTQDGATVTRDILRVGRVAAVLPYDPVAGCFVLIRQFRLSAHLATGKGDLVELVAGGVNEGEDTQVAAGRECEEEIGVTPLALLPMLTFMPTPGVTDEHASLYLGFVDSTRVPVQAGAAAEAEQTHPFTIPVEDALEALHAGAPGNVFLLVALQWFALNRERLGDLSGR